MAGLAALQEHIETLKTGTPEQKKQKLTPESIADVRKFIAVERANRNAGTHYSLESQFHEWEDLVKKYETDKGEITTATATATASVGHTVQGAITTPTEVRSLESVKVDIERELSVITDADIARMGNSLSTTEAIISVFEKVNPAEREAVRGFFGLSLLKRLSLAGYQVTLPSNKIEIKILAGSKATQAQAVQLETFLAREPMMRTNIAYGLIYNSSRFQEYAVASTKVEGDKKTVPTPTRNYLDYLSAVNKGQSHNQLSLEDQALLASRGSIDNILRDQKQVNSLILGAPQIGVAMQTLTKDPTQVQQVAQAITKAAQSAPITTPPHTSTNNTPTSNNLLAKYLGKAGLAVEGGASDLMNTPGAMPALIMAFIATWIFGDFKKALMVLGGAFGISAVANVVQKPNENPSSGQTNQPTKTPKSSPKMDHTLDISKMGPNEKKLFENLGKTPSITKTLDNRQEKLSTYVEYIAKANVFDKTLTELVYTTPFDQSIFANKPDLPPGIILPAGVNALMLKRILRVLISGVDTYDVTDPNGEKHTQGYKAWTIGQQNVASLSDDDWKKKTIKSIVPEIAKKF